MPEQGPKSEVFFLDDVEPEEPSNVDIDSGVALRFALGGPF